MSAKITLSAKTAPLPTVNFALSAKGVSEIVNELIQKQKALNDSVAALPADQCTFESVIIPLGKLENETNGRESLVTSLSYISPDKEIRDASVEAERQLQQFQIEQDMREDLYEAICATVRNTSVDTLKPEDNRLLTKIELDFRRNGLHLPKEQRDRFKELKQRYSELKIVFQKNLNEESSTVKFTREELEGMDDDLLGGLKQETGEDGVERFVLTMKYPDVFPVLKQCKRENTRRILSAAYDSRNKENITILEETVKLRREMAKILGYDSHAAFILEVKMAKTVENVTKFSDDLVERLKPVGLKELERLKELKKAEKESHNEPFDDQLHSWDYQYYNRILLETEYQVNQQVIKQYFPLEKTVQNMLDIYETVLGIKFAKVPREKTVVWHPDVELFECWDNSGEFSGYMYLDLFPRESKYSHAACFRFQASYKTLDELTGEPTRVPPIAAMVANFSKPTKDKPSLLRHEEVITLFHELGHVMHHLCSRTKWSRFHGTRVERDFVEAPSQMLENWCWQSTTLRQLSSHYETGQPIPDEIIEKIVRAKQANVALFHLRQLFFGVFDMRLHVSEEEDLDSTKLYNTLREEIALVKASEGTFGQAAFGHIMGGYDAGYYGYLWSKVYSSDMFYSKFSKDPLDSAVGNEYRRKILEHGGSKDGMDMVRDFLGRDPLPDAFMREDIGA